MTRTSQVELSDGGFSIDVIGRGTANGSVDQPGSELLHIAVDGDVSESGNRR